jgi:hypothetical protein
MKLRLFREHYGLLSEQHRSRYILPDPEAASEREGHNQAWKAENQNKVDSTIKPPPS